MKVFVRTQNKAPRRFMSPIMWGNLEGLSEDTSYGEVCWELEIVPQKSGPYLFKGDEIPPDWEFGIDGTSISFDPKFIISKRIIN